MRIFISYRRADLGGHAEVLVGRLSDRLIAHFGESNVFLDVITIPPGRDFDEFIGEHVARADAVLVIIGPDWLVELRKRVRHDEDFVYLEVKAALERRIPVIPVLMGDALMPTADGLPESLHRLTRKNAFVLGSGRDFHSHVNGLIKTLESLTVPTFIERDSFCAVREDFDHGNTLKFLILRDGTPLSYGKVIEAWIGDHDFRDFYCSLMKKSGLASYVWETPAITTQNLDRPFEFVLLSIPKGSALPDRKTYEAYFVRVCVDSGVVAFANLGKDALLVVPSPVSPEVDYSNLAAFFTNAPDEQQHGLWIMVGKCAKERLSEMPLWLSVAGGGIAWLHVRLDKYPKYYRYSPYKVRPPNAGEAIA